MRRPYCLTLARPTSSSPRGTSVPRRRFPLGVRCCVLRVSGAFPKRETRNPNVTGGANDMVDWLDRVRIIHLSGVIVNRVTGLNLEQMQFNPLCPLCLCGVFPTTGTRRRQSMPAPWLPAAVDVNKTRRFTPLCPLCLYGASSITGSAEVRLARQDSPLFPTTHQTLAIMLLCVTCYLPSLSC